MANVKNAVKKIKQINKVTLAHQQLKSTVDVLNIAEL